MTPQQIQAYKKAGNIAKQAVEYAKQIIKPGMLLLDIANQIEAKIQELQGELAFPVSLAIDDIAAHSTPSYDSKETAQGLLKVDLGVAVNGFIADTAFSLDLENNKENQALIQASEQALEAALKIIKPNIQLKQIGETIQKSITQAGFSPIRNLSGHELGKNLVHAGLTIPNVDNGSTIKLPQGAYAIEPFSTSGSGLVYEGKPSGIYRLLEKKPTRNALAREILQFILENYTTRPFSQREIIKKFSKRALLSLASLEQQGIIKNYPLLVEKQHGKVAHSEHSILVTDKIEILTK